MRPEIFLHQPHRGQEASGINLSRLRPTNCRPADVSQGSGQPQDMRWCFGKPFTFTALKPTSNAVQELPEFLEFSDCIRRQHDLARGEYSFLFAGQVANPGQDVVNQRIDCICVVVERAITDLSGPREAHLAYM